MLTGAATLALTPVDTARAVAQVYTWSLLATIPLALAWVASLLLARATASTRALVWRSAAIALLVVFVTQQLPLRWVAWVLPEGLATPLVALGRMQVGDRALTNWDAGGLAVALILLVYLAGVLAVLTGLACDLLAVRRAARRATAVADPRWLRDCASARGALGVRRRVRLLVSDDWAVPATFGILRPVVIVPRDALRWGAAHRRALLLHELAHVRADDVLALLLARVACALCWFHPAAWLAARRLRAECELACDDRVLGAGVPRSDYASLLLRAAAMMQPARLPATTLAMAHGAGIRERVAAIADPARDIRVAGRGRRALAAVCTLVLALPLGALRPAPTRDVLTTLMRDARWEARAYAVIGLAQRP
ncbi:MAG TPA: M56 family metallopeptidase, partial [Gemmatimonadaceae bacterium]